MYRSKPEPKKDFMYYIQNHERNWGTDNYHNRPDLAELLSATVVVFWDTKGDHDNRLETTLHNDLDEVGDVLLQMLLRGQVGEKARRPVRIFLNQKRVIPAKINLEFREAEE